MDPNFFYIDWERLFEVLVAIVVLSFLMERALAPLFESQFYIKRFQGKSLKEIIAFIVGVLVCWFWEFDALSVLFLKETITFPGIVLTGAIVAGGSKASIKLFRDIMGFKSGSEDIRLKARQKEATGGTST
ncbi:hypothetical protein KAU51_04725 [Candidatus Parcubacteria bacterium]|nr:hypothetical protein [Candidatus Parcubacteria bacterium]